MREGKIVLIKDGAPTTHILKTMIAGFSDTVHNELFCMRLAARVGIEVPQVALHTVDDTCFLLIERYDREVKNRVTTRLHQEDICQALGILPYVKYERERWPHYCCMSRTSAKPFMHTCSVISIVFYSG